ncbi:MAG: AraC family transcriptional regulator [Prolixibacteraceae bacterium]
MKPLVEKVPIVQSSFLVKEETFKNFDISWHIHPEYEIALILKGTGKCHAGNYLDDFYENDLMLFSPNLPHSWYSIYRPKFAVKQIIVQFSYDFLGKDSFEKVEFANIKSLLTKAHQGLLFRGKTTKTIKKMVQSMSGKDGFERTIELLNILNSLSYSTEYRTLSSLSYNAVLNEDGSKRINKIFRYILDNFKRDIALSELATIAHMTAPAFCNYFKTHTKKTFTQFLNDVRIGHACKLIMEENLTIIQVSEECGYNNISHFNRQFKNILKMTPTQYKKSKV